MENYNIDLTIKVKIDTNKGIFIPSPADGVNILPLEREGADSGRTTSIIEYTAGVVPPETLLSTGGGDICIRGSFFPTKMEIIQREHILEFPLELHMRLLVKRAAKYLLSQTKWTWKIKGEW